MLTCSTKRNLASKRNLKMNLKVFESRRSKGATHDKKYQKSCDEKYTEKLRRKSRRQRLAWRYRTEGGNATAAEKNKDFCHRSTESQLRELVL